MGDAYRIVGAGVEVLQATLTACRSQDHVEHLQRDCRCKVRAAAAPSASTSGSEAVTQTAPYLG
eukprot:9544891-Alexandrium_andersonii.AAC.1